METMGTILSAFGLAAAAGLNAYIPLLVVALLARLTTWIRLGPPYEALTHPAIIGLLLLLALIEFFADNLDRPFGGVLPAAGKSRGIWEHGDRRFAPCPTTNKELFLFVVGHVSARPLFANACNGHSASLRALLRTKGLFPLVVGHVSARPFWERL